jgi:predicted mannosyl-3-phosphoglycerate phosphatase (HAD superfamily)
LRQTSSVLYIAVDSLIPAHGPIVSGFAEFTAELDLLGIPAVWLTSRSRLQFDNARRKLSHGHPFLAEAGCGVFLPEDYFHLRPEIADSKRHKSSVIRLGRFTCIPAAQLPPAAANALEQLSEDTGATIVNLRTLSPRELLQNTGLPLREAELARQRDFDELFFFAGASEENVKNFLAEARARNLQLRQNGVLWSLAVGASIGCCIRELTKLYDRSLRYHAQTLAIATPDLAADLFPHCEAHILLTPRKGAKDLPSPVSLPAQEIPLHSAGVWQQVLEAVDAKK